MDHDRQDISTPATRCAAGIMPVAVSLSKSFTRRSGENSGLRPASAVPILVGSLSAARRDVSRQRKNLLEWAM
jgi:hypothetical protein